MAAARGRSPVRGREVPRLWTKPLRPLTPETSLGFEAIAFGEDVLGLTLLPWQKWLLIHALELLPDGSFRFRTVIVQVARQNGKTTLLIVLALWRMFVDRAPLVIGAAQDLDVAEETWEAAVDICEGVEDLAAEIKRVDKTNGRKTLRLVTGERYKPKAATRRAGRGLSGDLVALDELREHQTWHAWAAVTKTTMARDRAQIWGLSNAGDDASVVLKHLRRVGIEDLARAGEAEALAELKTLLAAGEEGMLEGLEDEDLEDLEAAEGALALFEWSAPPGADKMDREAWAQANPSLGPKEEGYLIRESTLAASARTDDEAVFRTENMCQWVADLTPPLFGPGVWEDRLDPDSSIESDLVLAVEVSVDRRWASIAAAGRRLDGDIHGEVTGRDGVVDHKQGTKWVVPRLVQIKENLGRSPLVIVDGQGPASSLVPAMEKAGIEVEVVTTQVVTAAAATVFDLIKDGRLWHLGQPDLDAAAAGARERTIGDKWGIGRRLSAVDVSPLVALTLAAYWVEVESVNVLDSVW